MNLIKYIERYGNLSFDAKPLNEVDKLIFGLLSYVKYDETVSTNEKNKKTIKSVAEEFFSKNYHKNKNIIPVKGSIKLLKIMKNKKRYCNLYLYNNVYIVNEEQQFSAICIEINPQLVYVSFEGTDQMISGWEEDFKISYQFPVKSQRSAIKYLNKYFTHRHCKIILGGHSKGGNLALVAGMYANYIVRKKIINIYSYDGPGLMKRQIQSNRYKKIANKFIHIIPNNSIVGLFLRHDKYLVVKSNNVGIMSHYALTWQVTDENLVMSTLSSSSREFELKFTNWLDNYTLNQRQLFVKEIFEIFRINHIKSLIDIMNHPKIIFKLLKDVSTVDPVVNKMTKEFLNMIKRYFLETLREKIISDNIKL